MGRLSPTTSTGDSLRRSTTSRVSNVRSHRSKPMVQAARARASTGRANVVMDLEPGHESFLANVSRRGVLGCAHRVEKSEPAVVAVADPGADHRVLKTPAAETGQHAARIQTCR